MADHSPIPAGAVPEAVGEGLILSDFSLVPKWRVFSGYDEVMPGTARSHGESLVWSVSPGEWTVAGPRPDHVPVVDLTHVRVTFRLTGSNAARLLSRVCALDLGDDTFPHGAAARTLVAGVATELVRDDQGDTPSYLILPSRSYGRYIHSVLVDAGNEYRLR